LLVCWRATSAALAVTRRGLLPAIAEDALVHDATRRRRARS
jgi:hypothetical protein